LVYQHELERFQSSEANNTCCSEENSMEVSPKPKSILPISLQILPINKKAAQNPL